MTNNLKNDFAAASEAAVDSSKKAVSQASTAADELIARAGRKTGKATKRAEKVAKKALKKVDSTYRKRPGVVAVVALSLVAAIAAIVIARRKF